MLGSTGSIGTQTLDVARRHPDRLEIVALAAGTRVDELLAQAREFGVCHLAVGDERLAKESVADDLRAQVGKGSLGFGADAVAALVQLPEADVVVNALVGAAGLRASYETLAAGKVLALANKESLVVGGDLIMPLAAQVDARRRVGGMSPATGRPGRSCPSIPSTAPSTNAFWGRTRARWRGCGSPLRAALSAGARARSWRTSRPPRRSRIPRGTWARRFPSTRPRS